MRRTQRIDSGVVANDFGYNDRSELTSALMGANDHDYAYDSIGNRLTASTPLTTSTYSANALNQYLQTISTNLTTSTVSTNTLSYDTDGNLLSDGVTTYSWNGENRLIQASNATTVVTFKYDYMGRRFEKTVDATNTTRFVYDGWNLVRSTTMSNDVMISTNHYVWGLDLSQSRQGAGGVGGLLWVIPSAGGVAEGRGGYFPCYDANGNITDYVSTNGVTVAHYEYNPYGGLISSGGSMADDFVFRFSTKYFDSEIHAAQGGTGLYYYGYRYYSPELGRWLSKDPIGISGGLNLYAYANLNPIYFIDPYGLCAESGDSWSPDWGEVGDGVGQMLWGAFQFVGGAALTQGDSPAPGPLDVLGAGIAINGVGDMGLGYAHFLGGLTGTDTTEVPNSMINATINAFTGSDEAGDIAEGIYNSGADHFLGTSPP